MAAFKLNKLDADLNTIVQEFNVKELVDRRRNTDLNV